MREPEGVVFKLHCSYLTKVNPVVFVGREKSGREQKTLSKLSPSSSFVKVLGKGNSQ